MEILLAVLGLIVLFIIVLIYGPLVWGLIAHKLYIWYILPIFPEAPHLTYWNWVAILIFLSALKSHRVNAKEKSEEQKNKETLILVVYPWITLLFSWLFKIVFF